MAELVVVLILGMVIGIVAALLLFSPEREEESWDPQHLPDRQAGFPGGSGSRSRIRQFGKITRW